MRMELVGCNHQKRLKLDSEAENHSLFCNLTDELVLEILLRLPSKCSVRCKAVCKRWHAIISDSNYFIRSFIQHHHQIHGTCVDLFSLVFQNFSFNPQRQEKWSQIQAISENLISGKWGDGHKIDMSYIPCVTLPVPVFEGPQEFQLEACFADLLLCSHNNPSTLLTVYYICNIVTKQWVAFPPIPIDSVGADVGLLCNIPSCFECSKQYDFYKFKFWLVRIPLSKLDKINVHFNVDVDLFSSEEGWWTHSLAYLPRLLNEYYEKSPMIAYHGMLHKLTRDGIIVFDPTQQRLVSRIIDVRTADSLYFLD